MVELTSLPDRPDSERLGKMRSVLRGLPVEMEMSLLPEATTLRMEEIGWQAFDSSKEGEFAWSGIEAAGHHMLALDRVLDMAIAPWVLGRASLEASARVAWLRDQSITPSERTKRSLALRLDDLQALKKKAYQSVHDRYYEDIQKEAEGLGLAVDSLKDTVPGNARMVEDALGMGAFYREFSPFVHSKYYSQVNVVHSDRKDDTKVAIMIKVVVWAYSIASWRFFQTRNLPCEQLESTLGQHRLDVDLPPEFWTHS